MNLLIVIGLVLAGGTIAYDHLIHELPQRLAIVLYSAAVILVVLRMIIRRKTNE